MVFNHWYHEVYDWWGLECVMMTFLTLFLSSQIHMSGTFKYTFQHIRPHNLSKGRVNEITVKPLENPDSAWNHPQALLLQAFENTFRIPKTLWHTVEIERLKEMCISWFRSKTSEMRHQHLWKRQVPGWANVKHRHVWVKRGKEKEKLLIQGEEREWEAHKVFVEFTKFLLSKQIIIYIAQIQK